jgi:large subunit ribosomal protein L1
MRSRGKKYQAARQQVAARPHTIEEAVPLIQKVKYSKFDETVELAVRLGVDPKHSDQMVRGTVVLPHGLGKSKRVLVIANAEKQREAKEAGADEIGGEDMVEKITGGFMDFEAVVATPDMMRAVGKLGKVLGPRGLMPNPKTGTVTMDVGKAVSEAKAGKLEYRTDRGANVHVVIGKKSFDERALVENYAAVLDEIVRAKPSAAKGRYIRQITLTSTMGPGIHVDPARTRGIVEELDEQPLQDATVPA